MEDHVVPGSKWVFDEDVAAVFDNMLERSIPQYSVMRNLCKEFALQHITNGSMVVDLGCSRGGAIGDLLDCTEESVKFLGIDVSEPMLDACRLRFKSQIETNRVHIANMDLRTNFPRVRANVIMSVLCLQFIPIEYRQNIVKSCYDCLCAGGLMIFVEKVLGGSPTIDKNQIDVYYQHKKDHGYTQEDIDRKRLSLEGVLVPITSRWNEDLLYRCGFKEVDCFWRWSNFTGWVALK